MRDSAALTPDLSYPRPPDPSVDLIEDACVWAEEQRPIFRGLDDESSKEIREDSESKFGRDEREGDGGGIPHVVRKGEKRREDFF